MPVISQNFSSIRVQKLIKVATNLHLPGRTLCRIDGNEVLAERELKTWGIAEKHWLSIVYGEGMRSWSRLMKFGGDD